MSRMPQIAGMHHVGLTVSEISRSIEFYRDVMGMTLVRRRTRVDAGYVAAQTGYPGVALSVASMAVSEHAGPTVELAQYLNHEGEAIKPATNRPGVSHLCLVVRDLAGFHAELLAKNVEFRSAPATITEGPNKGGLVVYLSDPDGYTIELFEPLKGAAEPK